MGDVSDAQELRFPGDTIGLEFVLWLVGLALLGGMTLALRVDLAALSAMGFLGLLTMGLAITVRPAIVVSAGSVRRAGLGGGELDPSGMLRLVGCVGQPAELWFGKTLLERFEPEDWARATQRGQACAALVGSGLVDERYGNFDHWLEADAERRCQLQLNAVARRGTLGRSIAPIQPRILAADHEQLVVEIGGSRLGSRRGSFHIQGSTVSVPPDARVRAVAERVGALRWSASIQFTRGTRIVSAGRLVLDQQGVAELTWFAAHLEERAQPQDRGTAEAIPSSLRALRQTE